MPPLVDSWLTGPDMICAHFGWIEPWLGLPGSWSFDLEEPNACLSWELS